MGGRAAVGGRACNHYGIRLRVDEGTWISMRARARDRRRIRRHLPFVFRTAFLPLSPPLPSLTPGAKIEKHRCSLRGKALEQRRAEWASSTSGSKREAGRLRRRNAVQCVTEDHCLREESGKRHERKGVARFSGPRCCEGAGSQSVERLLVSHLLWRVALQLPALPASPWDASTCLKREARVANGNGPSHDLLKRGIPHSPTPARVSQAQPASLPAI